MPIVTGGFTFCLLDLRATAVVSELCSPVVSLTGGDKTDAILHGQGGASRDRQTLAGFSRSPTTCQLALAFWQCFRFASRVAAVVVAAVVAVVVVMVAVVVVLAVAVAYP